jgi:ATP-binding cassette, subfamily G (WHITE), member 2, PDR
VIKVLEMEAYADAVVGVPGEGMFQSQFYTLFGTFSRSLPQPLKYYEMFFYLTFNLTGLNVEQRKRLTIGVELAAKPALLLFLDEPTSGLDSQTAWSICALLRKLADNGQAILCTIHQPSAILFQEFDRLLFLAKGGKTVYFGEIGENSKILTSYFERNGSRTFGADENPAEVMLEVCQFFFNYSTYLTRSRSSVQRQVQKQQSIGPKYGMIPPSVKTLKQHSQT